MAQAIRNGQADRGILVCGSGAGVSVAACKFPGVRAAVCHDAYTARQAVEHDDLNILCLGARVIGPALARTLADAFLAATFSGEERHMTRLAQDRRDRIALLARGVSEQLGPQPIEQAIRPAHAVEHRLAA